MVSDLCHLHIDHHDIRYPNILQAPTGPSALPSLPSPRTGRRYPWRLVDLELCEKCDIEIASLVRENVLDVDEICYEVEERTSTD